MAESLPTAQPLILGGKSLQQVTEDVSQPLFRGPTRLWWGALSLSCSLLMLGVAAVWYQIATGIGT